MLEQPEMEEGGGAAMVSLKLALSQETRASLAAVRSAQESARQRARQQTRQARIWFALMVAGLALGAGTLSHRLGHWRQSRAKTARPTPVIAQAAIAPPAVAQAAIEQPTVAEPAPLVQEPAPPVQLAAAPVAAPATADASGDPAEGCDTSTRRGLWRRSAEACARAFAADPNNASLALAVAQAEHAHARYDEAARWAKRALALDPNAAEAYIIIARAEVENGRDEDARASYQRYLELAPRGWHKAEARAALRRASGRAR
jgi:tetratricopeptide (TPR) repeat protein